MSKEWFPLIDEDKCIGCLACYNKCKHGVYDVENGRPVVVYREGCIDGCHGCGNLCRKVQLSIRVNIRNTSNAVVVVVAKTLQPEKQETSGRWHIC